MKPGTEVDVDLFGYVPAMTQCDWCDKPVPLKDATVTTHHITEHVTEQEHYCCDDHAIKAWRERHGGDHGDA